jgi:hypothetical protein
MSDALGRRMSGFLIGMGGAITMALAGYLARCLPRRRVGVFCADHEPALLRRCQLRDHRALFGGGMAEPLRASVMCFSYGIGNHGKIIGPSDSH